MVGSRQRTSPCISISQKDTVCPWLTIGRQSAPPATSRTENILGMQASSDGVISFQLPLALRHRVSSATIAACESSDSRVPG